MNSVPRRVLFGFTAGFLATLILAMSGVQKRTIVGTRLGARSSGMQA
jgi:hypothetical protein